MLAFIPSDAVKDFDRAEFYCPHSVGDDMNYLRIREKMKKFCQHCWLFKDNGLRGFGPVAGNKTDTLSYTRKYLKAVDKQPLGRLQ